MRLMITRGDLYRTSAREYTIASQVLHPLNPVINILGVLSRYTFIQEVLSLYWTTNIIQLVVLNVVPKVPNLRGGRERASWTVCVACMLIKPPTMSIAAEALMFESAVLVPLTTLHGQALPTASQTIPAPSLEAPRHSSITSPLSLFSFLVAGILWNHRSSCNVVRVNYDRI